MKVILNEYIESLGRVGDIIDVKPGYARNYLFPRKLALPPTKHNMEIMKYKKVKAEKQLEIEKMSAREQKTKLEELTLVIEKKAGETDTLFGSVTPAEIQEKLEEMGVSIEKKRFHLDEPIKKLGIHVCKIRLIEDIVAEVKIEVLREGGEPEPAEEAPAEEAVTGETPTENETLEETGADEAPEATEAPEETPAETEAPETPETPEAPEAPEEEAEESEEKPEE